MERRIITTDVMEEDIRKTETRGKEVEHDEHRRR